MPRDRPSRHPNLGVSVAPHPRGYVVRRLHPEKSCARQGLKVGDVIETIDGHPMDGSDPGTWFARFRDIEAGQTVHFRVLRDDSREPVTMPIMAGIRGVPDAEVRCRYEGRDVTDDEDDFVVVAPH